MATGIDYCIENKATLSDNCLIKADKDFNKEDVLKKHIEYYNGMLNRDIKKEL